MTSAVLILPTAYRAAGNAFGVSQGWGEGNFSVPLSATGLEPATHYGCRADVTEGFLAMMADPPVEAMPLVAAMMSSFDNNAAPLDHWMATLATNNLARVQDEA